MIFFGGGLFRLSALRLSISASTSRLSNKVVSPLLNGGGESPGLYLDV
jgi:hypothetical protein